MSGVLGAGLVHLNVRDGRRVSTWDAFVAPVLDSPLLTVRTGSVVARVLVERGRVRGVAVIDDGQVKEVRCSGDVILSGGTIGSAQLLLLSGIGPADELRPLGVDVAVDLPGVGSNLHDHTLAPVVYATKRPVPPGQQDRGAVLRPERPGPAGARPAAGGRARAPAGGRGRHPTGGTGLHPRSGDHPHGQPRAAVAALHRPGPGALPSIPATTPTPST
ncbi:GMC family oxidoreductase N-terminal domain-containing protein [Streptomyces sp. NPDC006356]